MAAKSYFGRCPAVHYFWSLCPHCLSRDEALQRMADQLRDGPLVLEQGLPENFCGLALSSSLMLQLVVNNGHRRINADTYWVKMLGRKPPAPNTLSDYVFMPDGFRPPVPYVIAPPLPKPPLKPAPSVEAGGKPVEPTRKRPKEKQTPAKPVSDKELVAFFVNNRGPVANSRDVDYPAARKYFEGRPLTVKQMAAARESAGVKGKPGAPRGPRK